MRCYENMDCKDSHVMYNDDGNVSQLVHQVPILPVLQLNKALVVRLSILKRKFNMFLSCSSSLSNFILVNEIQI